jgi:PKD repeat protein
LGAAQSRQLRKRGGAAILRYRRHGIAYLALIVLALVALSIGDPSSSSAAAGGLQNPGFEQGLAHWTADAEDAAVVVGTETPAQCLTYANMGGVTVAPFKGAKDLRLGACRKNNQSQPKGTNQVTQTFVANSSTLRFAFRVFSWEHRGKDEFSFELKKGSTAIGTLAAPVNVPMAGVPGGKRTCAGALPCKFTIDAGYSGQFVATNWITAVVNIPPSAIGQSLTLRYSVAGTHDHSHPTWAYFDNVNTPPVARFTHEFAGDLLEGDLVQFTDTSFDPDQPADSITSWRWEINGEIINEQNPVSIYPDEGTYSACLTVADASGETNRACSGGTASDGTSIAPLTLDNADPGVNAVNVETLAGQPAQLFGRTLEPGWEDALSATWQVGEQSPPASLEDDNLPFLSTGMVTGSITTAANAAGTLTVQDGSDGGTASDAFQVTVVPNDPQRHEPNGALTGSPILVSDATHISWIQSAGDQDIFEARLAEGQGVLPPGAELLVTLKGPGGSGLNADYDLVILSQLPEGLDAFDSGDSGQTSLDTSAWRGGAWRGGAWRGGAWRGGAWRGGAWRGGAWRGGAWRGGSGIYPLSQTGFNGISGNDIGSADVKLDELGLGTLDGNVSVAGYSANLGTGEETALVKSDVKGTRFFVVVLGANGAFSSSQPYSLQVESSVPIDPASALGPEVCNLEPLVGSDPNNPATSTPVDLNPGFPAAGTTRTLIITQRERIIALADKPETTGVNEGLARWSMLLPKLLALAQHPAVMADIISIPSTAYNDWDSNPCDVAEANAVAAAIRGQVQSRIGLEPTIEHVVLAGHDDVIPQRRIPDETIIGNEANYLVDALLKPGSPLFSSVLFGFILTDDYYVDDIPTPWSGRELYVPDRPIGRLVETPEEIGAAADAFLASNGVLDYSTANAATALVSGYDFFTDMAGVTADNLAQKLATTTLIDPTWTADELRCAMLGDTSGGLSGCTVRSVIAANAHFTQYAALSANGFGVDDFTDILTSTEVASAGGPTPALERRVVFTMGCHPGLNVPDRAAQAADGGLGIDPALDFAQAMARQRAVFIASTGYGLGDDIGLAGTELLLTKFADELVRGDVFIGNALRDSKESFLLSLLSMTTYDEKSSVQLTMFGLPMYRVQVPETAGSITPLQAEESPDSFTLTVDEGGPTSHIIEPVNTSNGTYLTADGDSQVTAFRAIQPRIVVPLTGLTRARGVLIKGGTYTDEPGFDPVISLPSQDWLLDDQEPAVCLDAFWPAAPVVVNGLDPGGGPQTLVVTPGQFRCTSGAAPAVTGVQRTYSSLTLEVLRSNAADNEPPEVDEVDFSAGAGGSLDVTVKAGDPSGIAKIVLLRYSGGGITSTESNFEPPFPASGPFTINVPNAQPADTIAGQIVDGAGNVAHLTGKGNNGFNFLLVDAGPDQVVTPGTPTTFQISVSGFGTLNEPFFTMDFGDGQSTSGPVTGPSFNIVHTYQPGTQSPATATLKVVDADGRLGIDTVELTRQIPIPAIFANSQNCTNPGTFNSSGSGVTVTGGMHSNANIKVSGSGHRFVGPTTYRCNLTVSGSNNVFDPPPVKDEAIKPLPVDHQLGDFPCTTTVTQSNLASIPTLWEGNNPASKVLKPGVICSNGKIELSGSGISGNVTFRAKGRISLSGSNWNLSAFWNDVLMFSDSTGIAADISGSGGSWSGIILAPKGQLKMSGSGNQSISGSLIADTINMSGSGWSLTAQDTQADP